MGDRLDRGGFHLKCFPVGRNDRYPSCNPSASLDCTADIFDAQRPTAIWPTMEGHRDRYAAPPTGTSPAYCFFHHKPNGPGRNFKKKKKKTVLILPE